MNLRNRGPSNLIPRVEDIRGFEREIARKRREEERQAHLDRVELEMEGNQRKLELLAPMISLISMETG